MYKNKRITVSSNSEIAKVKNEYEDIIQSIENLKMDSLNKFILLEQLVIQEACKSPDFPLSPDDEIASSSMDLPTSNSIQLELNTGDFFENLFLIDVNISDDNWDEIEEAAIDLCNTLTQIKEKAVDNLAEAYERSLNNCDTIREAMLRIEGKKKMEDYYFGVFSDWEDVQNEFKTTYPKPELVIFAGYDSDGYSGSAVVVFKDNGKFYYVQGGHCSCHGLEEQFDPEEYESAELLVEVFKKMEYLPYPMNDDLVTLTTKILDAA